MTRSFVSAIAISIIGLSSAVADEPAKPDIEESQKADAKTIFAGQCSWCHGDYGMKADKAPRLAGTKMSEAQVEDRIRNGKPNYMPAFRRFLNDGQISLMAKYIKSLEPVD